MVRLLKMSAKQLDQIRIEARAGYPEEVCGVLVGRDASDRRVVDQLLPLPNVAPPEQRRKRFAIDPLHLIEVERDLAGSGRSVIGFYHSHPDHPARPSETDREAAWAFYSYVIVRVSNGVGEEALTSWVLSAKEQCFEQQSITTSSG